MGLIDPSLLDGLGFLFNKRLTVQEPTTGRDSMGGETVETWTDKPGHVDIPTVVSPASSDEVKAAGVTVERDTYKALLQGHYPAVTRQMRAVVGGVAFDITGVLHDSQDLTTKLFCQVVA